MTKKAKHLKIQQYTSPIRRHKGQLETLKGLGLRGIDSVRELEDTPAVRGMLCKVAHMVRILGDA